MRSNEEPEGNGGTLVADVSLDDDRIWECASQGDDTCLGEINRREMRSTLAPEVEPNASAGTDIQDSGAAQILDHHKLAEIEPSPSFSPGTSERRNVEAIQRHQRLLHLDVRVDAAPNICGYQNARGLVLTLTSLPSWSCVSGENELNLT